MIVNKKKFFITGAIIVLCIVGFSNSARAELDPGEGGPEPDVYYPTSYALSAPAVLVGGSLASVRHYDGNSMAIRAHCYWFVQFIFTIDLYFYYPNVPAEVLRFGFTDNCDTETVQIYIRYSDGTNDFYPLSGQGSDGYWVVNLDPGKLLYRVYVDFHYSNYLNVGDRYLYVDVCTGVKYN